MGVWRVAGPGVIDETIEGETVAINLETGCYFSFNETASAAWLALRDGANRDRLAALLRAGFDGPEDEIDRATDALLAALAADGLIREDAEPAAFATAPAPASERRPFTAPCVKRFTDIQDLLLLDPIHEVDEVGWPQPKPE